MKRIGIILFDGFSLAEAASISEAFNCVNALADRSPRGARCYDVRLLSGAGGRVASSSSVFVWTDSVVARPADICDVLFVAGRKGIDDAVREMSAC